MILSVSWRNIWRNKLRSSVMLSAIAIGIMAGVYSWAFVVGMMNQRVESAIMNEASHIQIHDSAYMIDPDKKNFIPDAYSISTKISELPEVKTVSNRAIFQAMVSSAATGTGVKLVGVDPDNEKMVTDIHHHVVDGEYLTGIKRNPILIGDKLADKLKLKLRSKMVVTLQNFSGEITRAQFRVAGIYKTENSMYDEMNAFVRYEDLIKFTGMDKGAGHEIAVLLNKDADYNLVAENIKKIIPGHLDVKTWAELMPEVSLVTDSLDIFMIFFMVVVMVGLGFGIVNTMLMAILERIKEIGMLMAIGMSKLRVFRMILTETTLLSISGTIIGIFIAVFLTWISSKYGLDFSQWSKGMEAIGYSTLVYPVLQLKMIFYTVVLVVVTAVIASIFPAIKALRLNPAEAVRTDN